MKSKKFQLVSEFNPAGDQPKAINDLVEGIKKKKKNQVLLGVTGSGKTFTMANIIKEMQRPSLIMVHNKTLAAQLYSEMKSFFPKNAVEYFISFFDYYQPEAYIAASDTYIDKDSSINAKIEQMKHSTMYSLLERRDVIIVASVSSIYGIGDRSSYENMALSLDLGDSISINKLCLKFIELQYVRNDISFDRGNFRVKGDIVEIFPVHSEDNAIRISFFGDEIEKITVIDYLTGARIQELEYFRLYSASLYAAPKDMIIKAIPKIRQEMQERINYFNDNNKYIEAQRIEERTNFDLEMLVATGYCKGIENYTRYLSNRKPEETPSTLFDYLPDDTIIFVDESHVSVPQIRAMYHGDRSRKENLSTYGFRLPSCKDNRPLKFEEWDNKRGQTIFISATPAEFELDLTQGEITEQVIRPTGLLDPICIIRPLENQVEDLMLEIKGIIKRNEKALVITLTKKMAEHVSEYLNEYGIKAKYLHSDIQAIDRVEIIKSLRQDKCDVIVGINLLREGLDIPECSLVAILDADKEGFLRSKTSLIQTIGRAARNINGKVLLYADKMTNSLEYAIEETRRRRSKQEDWNKRYNITPETVYSKIVDIDISSINYRVSKSSKENQQRRIDDIKELVSGMYLSKEELQKQKEDLTIKMNKAAKDLDFELAIEIRERIKKVDNLMLNL